MKTKNNNMDARDYVTFQGMLIEGVLYICVQSEHKARLTKFSLKSTVFNQDSGLHVQDSVLPVQSKQSKFTENNQFWSHFL